MGNGKTRKKTSAGVVVLQGVLVSLGIYLLAAVVLALLAVKGAVPEGSLFPVLAVCCGVCALAGGMTCARRVPWGVLPGAMAAAAGFAAVLAAVGLLCWTDGVTWTGRGGILLACLFFGFCDALQIRLQVSGIAIPYQFFQMIPYVATVVVLTLIGARQAGPKANGKPYRREQR